MSLVRGTDNARADGSPSIPNFNLGLTFHCLPLGISRKYLPMHPYLPPSKAFLRLVLLDCNLFAQISYPCNCKKFPPNSLPLVVVWLTCEVLATMSFLDDFFHLDLSPSNNSYRGSAAMSLVCQPTGQELAVEGEIDGPREQL